MNMTIKYSDFPKEELMDGEVTTTTVAHTIENATLEQLTSLYEKFRTNDDNEVIVSIKRK